MARVSDVLSGIVVGPAGLTGIVEELERAGYDVWGPAVRDGAIVARPIDAHDELPIGLGVANAPGSSRLESSGDRSRFGWAVGPQTWKPVLHPGSVVTMQIAQHERDQPVVVSVRGRPARPLALFGLRPCDLAAIDVLDRALVDAPPTPEPTYRARRADAFLVVVNCGRPASTCGCTSFGTGPHVTDRRIHDIEVTELVDGPDDEPRYVVRPNSDRAVQLLNRVDDTTPSAEVSDADVAEVVAQRLTAEAAIERHLPSARLHDAFQAGGDLDRWDEIAETCVACGNCTAVCPTCFCTTIDDIGDLSGATVERNRVWESCFSLEFSRLGDRSVRSSVGARYRQWMTHKLGTWHDQFGESGCVGCGRCTTWCPVGIDFVDVANGFVDALEAP